MCIHLEKCSPAFAQEAKQAVDLMRRWAPIDIADALELLSPVFESEEVFGLHYVYAPHPDFGC